MSKFYGARYATFARAAAKAARKALFAMPAHAVRGREAATLMRLYRRNVRQLAFAR